MDIALGHLDRAVAQQVPNLGWWHPGGNQPSGTGVPQVVGMKVLNLSPATSCGESFLNILNALAALDAKYPRRARAMGGLKPG
jgi:hypothetical protein